MQTLNSSVYEKNGVKAEIIQEVGGTAIANNSTVYEKQIIKQELIYQKLMEEIQ